MTEDVVSVSRSVRLAAPASEVWGIVGNFQRLPDWHPAFSGSVAEKVGDVEFRHLTLADGGEIYEQLVDTTTHSYTYRIIKSPLPIEHYESRVEVWTTEGGSEVTWSSSFTPKAEGMEDVIAGVYEAGLNALAERFGT